MRCTVQMLVCTGQRYFAVCKACAVATGLCLHAVQAPRCPPLLSPQDPARYVDELARAGADGVTFHWEVVAGAGWQGQQGQGEVAQQQGGGGAAAVAALVGRIRGVGMRAGVALAPDTPLPVRGRGWEDIEGHRKGHTRRTTRTWRKSAPCCLTHRTNSCS